jgi:hypothetical protein
MTLGKGLEHLEEDGVAFAANVGEGHDRTSLRYLLQEWFVHTLE